MAFANQLDKIKPRTAAEHYDAWYDELPAVEQDAVVKLLRSGIPNGELKHTFETDEDYPAPKYGMTAFREWKATV